MKLTFVYPAFQRHAQAHPELLDSVPCDEYFGPPSLGIASLAAVTPPEWEVSLFDDRIECATCHRLGSADEDLLVRFEDRYGLCQGCHEHGIRKSGEFYASLP